MPASLNALLGARLDRLDPEARDALERGAVEGELFHRGAVVELSDARARLGPRQPRCAHRARTSSARPRRLRRRERVPLQAHPRPRRRLPRDCRRSSAPTSTSGSPTGWSGSPGERVARVRGDPRLPPRAELPLPHRARPGRRRDARARRACGPPFRGGGPPGLAPRRRRRGEWAAPACGRPSPGRPSRPRADRRAARRGADGRRAERRGRSRPGRARQVGRRRRDLQRPGRGLPGELELGLAPTREIVDRLRRTAGAAIDLFAANDEEQALVRACWLLYLTSMILCRAGTAREAIDRLISVSGRFSDPLPSRLPGMLAMNLAWGPTPVPAALAETESILRRVRDDPAAEPRALGGHAYLLAQDGAIAAAREALARMREIVDRHGQLLVLWSAWGQNVGRVELLAGDPAHAERALRPAYEGLVRGAAVRLLLHRRRAARTRPRRSRPAHGSRGVRRRRARRRERGRPGLADPLA